MVIKISISGICITVINVIQSVDTHLKAKPVFAYPARALEEKYLKNRDPISLSPYAHNSLEI